MVQVDVFWTYALGASFAAAAGRQISEEAEDGASPFRSPFYVRTLLYLSILFGPSGVYLCWAFPGWETMFAGDREMPAWIVTLFCMTNITQGILGYWIASKLVSRGRLYWAHLQWIFGYIAMFFILVHGWDGTGYQRFFYAGTIEEWRAGVHYPIWAFAYCKVALSLYGMGVILLPIMFFMMSGWMMEGYRLGRVDPQRAAEMTRWSLSKVMLRIIFVYSLGSAIAASLLIHLLGWLLGALAFFVLFAVVGVRKGGLFHKVIGELTLEA